MDVEDWIFTTDKLPENPRWMPTVGNGHLATVVHRDRLFVNGLYNGADKESHRAMIPALTNVTFSDKPDSMTMELDCMRGIVIESLKFSTHTVTHTIYAHRLLDSLLVHQVNIIRTSGQDDIIVKIDHIPELRSKDLTFQILPDEQNMKCAHGKIINPETEQAEILRSEVFIWYDEVTEEARLESDENEKTLTYFMFVNFKRDSQQIQQARQLLNQHQLLNTHLKAWEEIWCNGCISVKGNKDLNSALYGCLYYLYSSCPYPFNNPYRTDDVYFGISPESLAYGDMSTEDYQGHVFWDQELWMYPPMLLLQPSIAAEMLKARCRVIDQTSRNAQNSGNKGLRFPWEQGSTGVPTSPSDDCEHYEIHVNSDIALAIRSYLQTTSEISDELESLVHGIAEYWESRVTLNEQTGLYEIQDVMPPDEYNYPVNNSAFTNMSAKITMEFSDELVGGAKRKSMSDKIFIPFDEKLQYHPEFDGYKSDAGRESIVKQADVVLIGFPLLAERNQTVRQNDLEIYQRNTTKTGPAMTWSMFCIGHLELGQYDKATTMYEQQFAHIKEPFKIWTELPSVSDEGAINFITGMGGFLQSILNGYAGIRVSRHQMSLNLRLPPNCETLNITGLSYLGSKLNITLQQSEITVELVKSGQHGLYLNESKLVVNNPVSFKNVPFKLSRSID